MHLFGLLRELFGVDLSLPSIKIFIADFEGGLVEAGQVIQLDTATKVIELYLETSHSEYLSRQLELKCIVGRAGEPLLHNYNFSSEVFLTGLVISV